MALGQIEFTLILAIAASFFIFTPEPLVLLRNLCVLASLVLVGWHGFGWWERKPWIEKLATDFAAGRGLDHLVTLVWGGTVGPVVAWVRQRIVWARKISEAVVSEVTRGAKALFSRLSGRSLFKHRSSTNSPRRESL